LVIVGANKAAAAKAIDNAILGYKWLLLIWLLQFIRNIHGNAQGESGV
jgi:hypothetical protein